MEIALAIILGTLFGFVLQRVGAADPDKIIGMLTLRDLHLMKAIPAGIGIASLLLFGGMILGVIDPGQLSIKAMYWGVIGGGFLLGFGWALAGYCPGTGIVAAGAGRKDGFFFIIGGLVGAGLFSLMFGSLKETFLFTEVLGGKTTLVATGAFEALIEASWSPYLALIIALAMLVLAGVLPNSLR